MGEKKSWQTIDPTEDQYPECAKKSKTNIARKIKTFNLKEQAFDLNIKVHKKERQVPNKHFKA